MANKAELIEEVAKKTGLEKKKSHEIIDALFNTITDELKDGNKVQLIGFGTFEIRERAARKGRNPQTGEEIQIKASKIPAFKPGKGLKDTVNN